MSFCKSLHYDYAHLMLILCSETLPVAWIGNVLAISALKPTLGDTIISVKEIFVPMVYIAILSWVVSLFLSFLSTAAYAILLPFVAMIGCLVIILCPYPYLTMKNLMLVVFYLIVASPLSVRYSDRFSDAVTQEDLGPYFVPGLVGTCAVGLSVAVFVHIMVMMIPIFGCTSATRLSKKIVQQLSFETCQILQSVAEYTSNIGKSTHIARQSRTLIEFYVKRRHRTLERLEKCIPAIRAERYLTKTQLSDLDRLEAFLSCSKKQQKHAELIRLATTQLFLGEEVTSQNDTIREVKTKIALNLGYAVEQLTHQYKRSEQALFFDGSFDADEIRADVFNGLDTCPSSYRRAMKQGLDTCLSSYRQAMKQAITDAEALLLEEDADSKSSTGPLIRQRVAFLGMYSLVQTLSTTIASLDEEGHTIDDANQTSVITQLKTTLKMPWLWRNLAKRRMAVKTAFGFVLASLWVSIPYLREYIAYPNSIWVGVTVVSLVFIYILPFV